MRHIASCGICPSSAKLHVKVAKRLQMRSETKRMAKGDGFFGIQAGQELQSVSVAPSSMVVPGHEGSMERSIASSQPSPRIGLLDVAKAELQHSSGATSGDRSSGEGEEDGDEDFDMSAFRNEGSTSFSNPSAGTQQVGADTKAI